jgi:hypothetical protein
MRVGNRQYDGTGVNQLKIPHNISGATAGIAWVIVSRYDNSATSRFRTPSYADEYNSPFTGAISTNHLELFPANGSTEDLQLGTGTPVNANGGSYLVAFFLKDTTCIAYGRYTGNGTSKAISGLGFQPDIVMVKRDGLNWACIKTDTMGGTASVNMEGDVALSTAITSLDVDGFSVGASAFANANGDDYYWVAIKKVTGNISTFTYTGDGNDNRAIAHGLGQSPSVVIMLPINTSNTTWKPSYLSALDETIYFKSQAKVADAIQSWDATNITVGTHAVVNLSGRGYHGIAFGDVSDDDDPARLCLLGVGA